MLNSSNAPWLFEYWIADVKMELGKVNEVVLYSYILGAVLAGDEEMEVRGGDEGDDDSHIDFAYAGQFVVDKCLCWSVDNYIACLDIEAKASNIYT